MCYGSELVIDKNEYGWSQFMEKYGFEDCSSEKDSEEDEEAGNELPETDSKFENHFPKDISEEIKRFAIDKVFKHYVFVTSTGRKRSGYCTYCRKHFDIEPQLKTKQKEMMLCPECGCWCETKYSGYSRKYLIDEVYYVWYEKSLIDSEAIIGRGIYAARDYRADYTETWTQYVEISRFVFKVGQKSQKKVRCVWYDTRSDKMVIRSWDARKTISSLGEFGIQNHHKKWCSAESIKAAVKGTQFEYSTWEKYFQDRTKNDMVEFFDLFARNPSVEYITKSGFGNLIRSYLSGGEYMYDTINWRGKTLQNILRIDKKDMKAIRAAKISVTPKFMKLYQIQKVDKSNFSATEIEQIVDEYDSDFQHLVSVASLTDLRQTVRYIDKQYKKHPSAFRFKRSVLSMWYDYLFRECMNLGMDITNEAILFPKDLYEAHHANIKKIKYKANEKYNEQIAKRVDKLNKKYRYERFGLLIRPVTSVVELVDEGSELGHCVGGYAPDYAFGHTDILVIRRLENPDNPFFTMEVRKGEITQVYGLNHCHPDEEVEEFLEFFELEKLKAKNRKTA